MYCLKKVEPRLYLKETQGLYNRDPVCTKEDVSSLFLREMVDFDREIVLAVNFDTKMRPLNYSVVSIGDIDASMVPIRNVFKAAVLSNATFVMLIHNHPSGIVSPSDFDVIVTKKAAMAGNIIGIPLVDHVIVGGDVYYSFKESMPDVLDTTN